MISGGNPINNENMVSSVEKDDSSDLNTVCLPGCSNREYTSSLAHLLIYGGVTVTSGLLLVSSILLTVGIKTSDDTVMNDALIGFAGTIGSGLLTCCGFFAKTKRKMPRDEEPQPINENSKLFSV